MSYSQHSLRGRRPRLDWGADGRLVRRRIQRSPFADQLDTLNGYFQQRHLLAHSEKLAPGVTDHGKRSVHHKANAIENGTFQYDRKIVVRRSPRTGVVSSLVCQSPMRTTERGCVRSCPKTKKKSLCPRSLHYFKMTF